MLKSHSKTMDTNLDELTNEPIVAVCAADDNYAMPLAVMARSAIANLNASRKLILFIIDGGIEDKNKQKILKTLNSGNCEVKFLPKPDLFAKSIENAYTHTITQGQGKKYITITAYYRLMIAKILPEEIEKVIFLDCDLVIKGDLEQLWQSNLGENFVLAAQDTWIPSVSVHNGLLNYKQLKIDPNAKYFNAGVFIANLKKWRSEGFFEKAVDYLNQNKEFIRLGDQDILNALLVGKWGELDLRWNVTPGIYEYDGWEKSPFSEEIYNNLIQDPWIIHFASDLKPWNSRKTLLKENFFHYVDMTAWSGWRFTLRRQFQKKVSWEFQKLKELINRL